MLTSSLRHASRPGLLAALTLWVATCLAADAPADFEWVSYLAPAQTLEIRLIDGSIRVEPSDTAQVEVTAWKTGSRPDPASVRIEAVQYDGGLLICAVYPSPRPDRPNRCTIDNSDNNVMLNNPDLKVDFVVRIPAGVLFRAAVINGSVDLNLRDNPADVGIVNGRLAAATPAPLQGHVVNGSIEASLGNVSGKNGLGVVNGSVQVTLASSASAAVHARTVFGPITSDFPLSLRHFLVGNAADGVLGDGAGELRLDTVSGKIVLRRAADPQP